MTESLPPASSTPEDGADNFQTFPLDQVSLPKLRQWLFASFTIEELNGVLFDLGIDSEEITGTTKSARIVSLLRYVRRIKKLRDLLLTVAKECGLNYCRNNRLRNCSIIPLG